MSREAAAISGFGIKEAMLDWMSGGFSMSVGLPEGRSSDQGRGAVSID